MQLSKNLLALSIAVSLAGCSSMAEKLERFKAGPQEEVVAVEEVKPFERVESKPERTSRDSTLSWDNIGRAGAAIHQPGYVHVLGKDGHTSLTGALTGSGAGWPKHNGMGGMGGMGNGDDAGGYGVGSSNSAGAGHTSKHGNQNQGYSMYQLSRWERYCNSGKGMDERDWRFVQKEGYGNAPLDALGGVCLQPTHRYEGYLSAWVRFCTSSPKLSSNDRRIVRNSSRPFSKVNPCQALSK